MEQAIRLCREAIQYWRQIGRVERTGDDLRWLSRLYWFQGIKEEADRFAAQAIDLLEQLPPGQELAVAYSNRAQPLMLAEEIEAALDWGNRALELARELDLHDHVARCFANLSSFAVLQCDYHSAEGYLSEGIGYTSDRNMDSYSIYLRGWQARLRFEQGDWVVALRDAEEVLRLNLGSAVMSPPAVTALACVKMRQGNPEARQWLDQARDMAQQTGGLQRICPVAAARAEAA
jgi:tetratricopeptide (TPR) repeat protein